MPDPIIANPADSPTTPTTVQSQVQDIFSETDSPMMPADAVSHDVTGPAYTPYASTVHPSMNRKTMILIVGAIVALVGIVGAAILIYMLLGNTSEPTTNTTPTTVQQPNTTPPVTQPTSSEPTPAPTTNTEPTVSPEPQEMIPPAPSDRDGDGLTDAEEGTFNTNPDLPDTDNDGLTDREEVNVYKTNPNNADTDSDGYLDGQEVRAGYNPNGPGLLYKIQ
ncbi:MAG: hypothetical protein AAB870_04450 [Patescibacteria group bacterium]